jgi:hypothetical protein
MWDTISKPYRPPRLVKGEIYIFFYFLWFVPRVGLNFMAKIKKK